MIEDLMAGMSQYVKPPYMFDRIPSVYGQDYYWYWKRGSYKIEVYKENDKPENYLESFYPIEVENIVKKYSLDREVIENYLKYHLSLYAFVRKDSMTEICNLVGKEYYIDFENRMESFGKSLVKAVDDTIRKSKIKLIK